MKIKTTKMGRGDSAVHLAELAGACRELEKGDDFLLRTAVGTPLASAIKSPKGHKMKAYGRQYGHAMQETLKGTGKGALAGVTTGTVAGAALALRGKSGAGKTLKKMLKSKATRKAVMGKAGGMALKGAAIGGGAGAYVGAGAGSMKGHFGKEATDIHHKAKRGELAELAEECRELGTVMAGGGLMANERGEMPWQAHQRKKRNENMVKGAAGVAGAGAAAGGYLAHQGVKAAGGYKAVGDVAKTAFGVARQAQGGIPAKGVVGAGVAGVKGAAKAVMPGAKTAAKGVGSAAMNLVKKLRR